MALAGHVVCHCLVSEGQGCREVPWTKALSLSSVQFDVCVYLPTGLVHPVHRRSCGARYRARAIAVCWCVDCMGHCP